MSKKNFLIYCLGGLLGVLLTLSSPARAQDKIQSEEPAVAGRKPAAILNDEGIALAHGGQIDQAIQAFTQAIQKDKEYAEAYKNRGVAYYKKGDFDKAIADYSQALKLNPRYTEAWDNRGVAYARKEKFDQAIADFNRALEINPDYWLAYKNRGVAHARRRQFDKAIADFNQALKISPKDAETIFNRALALDEAGRLQEARDAYQAFVDIASSSIYGDYINEAKARIKDLEGSRPGPAPKKEEPEED